VEVRGSNPLGPTKMANILITLSGEFFILHLPTIQESFPLGVSLNDGY
jgi:hypothetical protein